MWCTIMDTQWVSLSVYTPEIHHGGITPSHSQGITSKCELTSFTHKRFYSFGTQFTNARERRAINVPHSMPIQALNGERPSKTILTASASTLPELALTTPVAAEPPTCINDVDGLIKDNSTRVLPSLLKVSPQSLQYEPGFLGGISSKTRPSSSIEEDLPIAMTCLTKILSSKVYDVAIESPVEMAVKLSERTGAQILLKREDTQPVCRLPIS